MLNIDNEIDCIGLFCPMPIVKTREAVKGMARGQLLRVLADDPSSEADMKSWCQRTGNELVDLSKDGAIYRFVVKKTR